jgi:hypothetical protein
MDNSFTREFKVIGDHWNRRRPGRFFNDQLAVGFSFQMFGLNGPAHAKQPTCRSGPNRGRLHCIGVLTPW